MTIPILVSVAVSLAGFLNHAAVFADNLPPLATAPLTAKQAHQIQRQWAQHLGKDLVYTNSIGMKLALVPPGEFIMGRTEQQLHELLKAYAKDPALKDQRSGLIVWSMLMMPAHRVRLTQPFYIGTTEVTVGQFRQFVEATGYKTEAERGLVYGRPYQGTRPLCTWRRPMVWRKPPLKQKDTEPVMHLCWNDCAAFCRWLSEKEGVPYELPTEAEWESARRGRRSTPWSCGGVEDGGRIGTA